MADVCKSCKAPIRWALTAKGRRMPLDREPDDQGEWALTTAIEYGGAPQAVHVPAERRGDYRGSLYAAHWATCPFADEHRTTR